MAACMKIGTSFAFISAVGPMNEPKALDFQVTAKIRIDPMTRTQQASTISARLMTNFPNRPIGLEKMVDPLAEVMAADDDPRATLREIIALLVRKSNQIKTEAKNCLQEATL
jgi:hypothetical protein